MTLLELLQNEPRARERSNKNRAIGNLMIKQYNLTIDKAQMADMVGEILSQDRKWRKILEENPELRGSDYGDKDILEQKKIVELGYNVTHETPNGSIGEGKSMASLF